MKTFFVLVGILASVCLQSNAMAANKKSIANKEEYLNEINDIRRKYAKEYEIPNMYKLVWDDSLESKTQMGDYSGKGKTMRVNYREGDDRAKEIGKNTMDVYAFNHKRYNSVFGKIFTKRASRGAFDLSKMVMPSHFIRKALLEEYASGKFVPGMEDVTPGQQKIGCSPMQTKVDVNNEKVNYHTICFMGPEGNGTSWNVEKGTAGSACSQGFKNEDGLCSPIQKPTTPMAPRSIPPYQASTIPVNGAAQIGIALILVISMIF